MQHKHTTHQSWSPYAKTFSGIDNIDLHIAGVTPFTLHSRHTPLRNDASSSFIITMILTKDSNQLEIKGTNVVHFTETFLLTLKQNHPRVKPKLHSYIEYNQTYCAPYKDALWSNHKHRRACKKNKHTASI